jgi:hypothetical protein
LLAGRDRFQNFFARRFLFDATQELFGDLKIHIRFQQDLTHLAQSFPDHRFGQQPARAEAP